MAYPRPARRPSGVRKSTFPRSLWAACSAAPTGEELGQCSSVCHWPPRQPRLASSAASASMSRGTSVLLCNRLHRTVGKSCGINPRCAARRPMGALSRSALCSLRLSATPPGLCLGSPKSNRRNGCRGMAGTKADLRSMSSCASSLLEYRLVPCVPSAPSAYAPFAPTLSRWLQSQLWPWG